MQKWILSGVGVLFVVALVLGGCSKSEEKKAEAPAAIKQTVQEKADPHGGYGAAPPSGGYGAALPSGGYDAALPAAEKSATMTDQAVEAVKEMGQAATESATKSAETSMEEAMKEKAVTEGMKLPGKY